MLRNRILIAAIILFKISHWCCAQSASSLSGKVLDDRGNVLSEAYIELLVAENSTPIMTVISNSLGEFQLSSLENINIIRIQYIGYETELVKAPFSSPLIVKMRAMELKLDEVMVIAQSPAKITSDGIKFSPTRMQKALPNITYYLSQLPFVEKSGDGFTIVGRGSAVIYINNRRVEDLSELKEIEMEEVQSVDVLPNPGVIYGSDIKAVLKINTKGKKSGMGVGLTSSIIHSELTEYWNRWRFSYNTPTLSLQSSIVYDYDPTRAHLEIEQLMKSKHSSLVRYNSTEKQLYENLLVRNSLVYAPNPQNSMGFSLTYGHSSWKTDIVNRLSYTDNISDIKFEQESRSKSPRHKWVGNLFYNYSNDKIDLLLNTDLYRGVASGLMTSITSDHTVEPDISTQSKDGNFLCYLQALGSYKASAHINFRMGADYAHTSVWQTYKVNGTHSALSPFDIKTYQHRYAGHASLNSTINPFILTLGLRHETLSINRENDMKKTRYRIFSCSKLYPSVSVSMRKKSFQTQLSYSMKTEYPAYNQLRAGLNYSSPYLYESGNPDLRPEMRHEISLLSKYLKSSLILNYTEVLDEIIQVPTLHSDNIMLYRPDNHGTNRYASLSISHRINWGNIMESSLGMNYQAQWMNVAGFTKERGEGYMLKINNTININKNIQLLINGAYRSSSENGLFKIPQAWNADLALNLPLLSNRLNIYLECIDVFSMLHGKRKYYGKNIIMDYSRNHQTRTFTVQVTYKLPNIITEKKYKGNTTNDEIRRL